MLSQILNKKKLARLLSRHRFHNKRQPKINKIKRVLKRLLSHNKLNQLIRLQLNLHRPQLHLLKSKLQLQRNNLHKPQLDLPKSKLQLQPSSPHLLPHRNNQQAKKLQKEQRAQLQCNPFQPIRQNHSSTRLANK